MSKIPFAARVLLQLDLSIDFPKKQRFILLKRLLSNIIVRAQCLVETYFGVVQILQVIPEHDQRSQDCVITMNTEIQVIEKDEALDLLESNKPSVGCEMDLHELMETLIFFPKTIRKLGTALPRGILLHGPPGVGKSSKVTELCKRWGCSLVITIN
jgi:ATP-dependent 26S proteasome regulatory subunit